ncbi:hypothetical protein Pla108_00710 [Botrimarina colliarenosi]|uniref:HAMP domain-containing protein n=1 Tax=Botrimarina colliarenosi TaxID=2528001 RepID=A0A5C6AIR6_9BACT|nr:methyl-accepting chemotaxis protein [Botrimarina colliarenosi]TWT99138.1 hypothetical protein Pla108_00710 [Botrimarina colliarenosi]
MSKKHLRKHYFVDRHVQGGIALRAARYWAFSVAVFGMLTVIGWVFVTPGVAALVESPDRLRALLACMAVASVVATLIMPVVLLDLMRFTNRFVGPMVRLREAMRAAAAGEHVDPIRFRDGDYWQEFADAFNAMQARIERPPAVGRREGGAPSA